MASNIFKQKEEEYYVYFYNFNEENNVITNIVNNNISEYAIYKVNTASALNANYTGKTSNKNATTLGELQVVAPTLIKISGDTITEYYENEEIKEKFN